MKRPLFRFGLIAAIVAISSVLQAKEPLYEGLGSYSRKVTTDSADAQRYFDQGFALLHGFNHGAAARSFRQAVAIDPECAMAHWGLALALGPHINVPFVPPPAAEEAAKAVQLARQHAADSSPIERELIEAIATRYAYPQPEDRSPLDRAYAEAMRAVWQAHPDDADIAVLFAESLLTLRPWDQWTPEGMPQPGTEEAIAAIEAALKLNLQHPLANHLLIHAVEASKNPERANAAADRLRELQPGLAHNVHMPSHIDIRNGRWHDAIVANEKAVEASQLFRTRAGPPQGPLHLYNAHNRHMLAYAAMMTGQQELSVAQIKQMVADMPEEFVRDFAVATDAYVAMPYEVLLRFGRWDDVLAAPDHPEYLPFARAVRHAARATALAAKGDTAAARAAQQEYLSAAHSVPANAAAGPVPLQSILQVVTPMVEGEIMVREGKGDDGVAKLREAVAAEDALRYFEPPAWFLPVRHALGASLMALGRYAEAEEVYREDLKRYPSNGWSLYGLADSLRVRGKLDDADAIAAEFKTIWSKADTRITSSCMCQPGA